MHQQQPKGYTRLGPAIRHASTSLDNEKANHKLIVLITDGKPTDMDAYEGRRGIEDVRMALKETELKRIHTWAMAIEASDKNYFKSMFSNYSLVSDPENFADELVKLLLKLFK
jgi:nitric oxide reductase NorD protein